MKAICKICYHYELCKEDERCLPEYLNCNFFKNKLDVVEVVRCKDCRFKTLTEDGEYNPHDIVCEMHMSDGFDENDYCSYGERSNDNV